MILTLVPKVPNPSKMTDFRPISCCNIIYKIIAKIIANRIQPCLPSIISPSQSAFMVGRRIGENILGCSLPSRHGSRPLRNVIDKHISTDQADFMSRQVTNDEIREVCFSLHPNKAPCPDGFNAHFFKKTWHIVGDDVINSVQEFFRTGLLYKDLNTTILTWVPKVLIPLK